MIKDQNNIFCYAGEDLEVMAETVNYRAWILSWFHRYIHGRTLEIGAGCGSIAQDILPWSESLELVEPDARLAGLLRTRFGDTPDLLIYHDTAEHHLKRLDDQQLDTVLLVNVLEHIKDDRAVLADLARVLTAGGHLLLFVPALPMLYAAMDAHLGHFRRYERTILEQLIRESGLQLVLVRYFDLPGILSWFLLKISRSTRLNLQMVKIYDRWVVPSARWLENRIPPPVGKNLLLVARKD
ncbi:MAG: class I SAM-dependent methyltransferase [Magnetococcus sp. YQC-5]